MLSIQKDIIQKDIEDLLIDKEEKKESENPYFQHAYDHSGMNSIYIPDEISEPLRKNFDMNDLMNYIQFIIEHNPNDKDEFLRVCTLANRKFKLKTLFNKQELWYGYQIYCKDKGIPIDKKYRMLFQSKVFRSQSGVMVFAIFTAAEIFSCKYDCAFCPQQPDRPRSYVDGEPGLDRAQAVGYDPIKQVFVRAKSYHATGHINDKAEVIVLGGTWHSYPLEYRIEFIRDVYYAFNTLHENRDRPKQSMEEEIYLNQTSECHIIGLTIETRPDQINHDELVMLRQMGVTRVQLGIQHTNDRILTRIKRNCSTQKCIYAIKMLKDMGFKVDIHLMPDLPKPFTNEFLEHNKHFLKQELDISKSDIDWEFDSVKADEEMFWLCLNHPDWQADQWKIYPFAVMPWTQLEEEFKKGLHTPYGDSDALIELLISVKSGMNPWIRLNRVVRDIPEEYIQGGLKNMSGRNKIQHIMEQRGLQCNCMRCREIKKEKFDPENVKLIVHEYEASGGTEYFFEYVTQDNKLIGFLRLRLSRDSGMIVKNNKKYIVFPELVDTALIRELHVYGDTEQVHHNKEKTKDYSKASAQNLGFGSRLIHQALDFSKKYGYSKIAVISGEGVRTYYERFGFNTTDGKSRMMLKEL